MKIIVTNQHMSPCWVKIKPSEKNEVLSKDTGQSGKVSLGRWQCRGSWVSWESRVEGEMSQLREPVMILRQEIVWQVSEEHQKSPRSWNWVEEGESGSKDGNLVSSCVDIGHSRLGWNEGIGGFKWHVFIYVLRISLWCWGTVASRSFKSTQRELQGDCYSSYQTKDHGGLHSAASRGCTGNEFEVWLFCKSQRLIPASSSWQNPAIFPPAPFLSHVVV